jgi:MYXO-CTERM domain-containing protein
MKSKLALASAFIALAVSSNAAIFVVTNVITGDGSSDGLFQNKNGTLSSGGVVSMGYFPASYVFNVTNPVNFTSTLLNLDLANFTVLTSAVTGSASASLSGSFPGYVEAADFQGANITTGNPLLGRALYVFSGNSATLAGSTQWGLKQVATIGDDSPLEQTYLGNPFGGSAPVIGSTGAFTGDASGLGSSTYQTLQMSTAVPEPSAALLGAIGALGLLRRRRN